jgi:hypothetical protein
MENIVITNNTKITEDSLPVALALYIERPDVEQHPWNEYGIWRFISGTDKRHPYQTAECTFSDAVAAFLLGEVSDYFGSWISETLEQTANCNNGKIIKVENTDVKRRSITVLSRPELDMLVADGFKPVGYNLQIFRSSGTK